MTDLVLHVKRKYFDMIRDGEKKFEYRIYGDYWKKRLENKEFEMVIIADGYPAKCEKERWLSFPYTGYEINTICHAEWDHELKEVFAIRLSKQGEP